MQRHATDLIRAAASALALACCPLPFTPSSPCAETAGGAFLDVPFLPQEPALCGGAVAAMVLRYWGEPDVDASTFADLVNDETGDIRVADLLADLEARGWTVVAFSATDDVLMRHLERGRPVIALVEPEAGAGHYVVITGMDSERVLVHDPALGPNRATSRAELDAMWSATRNLALLVLPDASRDATPAQAGDEHDAISDANVPDTISTTDVHLSPNAARLVREAQRLAASDRFEAAEDLLARAIDESPRAHTPLREMAALRFRQRRWAEAIELAECARELAPHDEHAVRIAATGRYLTGDTAGALALWNRLDAPHVDLVETPGLTGVRYGVVARRIDIAPGQLLTPGRLARAQRRLDALPAATRTHVRYTPSGGLADVDAVIVPRRRFAITPGVLLRGAVRALSEHEIVLRTIGPAERGELITLRGRWPSARRRIAASVATPDPLGIPGVLTLAARWEEESFSTPLPVRETRRRGTASLADWIGANLRAEATLGIERWRIEREPGADAAVRGTDDGSFALVGGVLEHRFLADRLALRVGADRRFSLDGTRALSSWAFGGAWRSTVAMHRPHLRAHAGVTGITAGAPRMLWPGAGAGLARSPLLRAHPLLENDVVSGRFLGTTLLYAGLEATAYPLRVGPIRLGAAIFADAARGEAPAQDASEALDLGAGLRVRVPGASGHLRVDVATDVRTGASALSAGWRGEWSVEAISGGR